MRLSRAWLPVLLLGCTLLVPAGRAAPAWHFQEPTERNVVYGMDHGAALLLDVYRPEKPNGCGVVFIMGTGFTAAGEYDDIPLKQLDRWLVEQGIFPPLFGGTGHFFGPVLDAGFTVFTINHRLAPAHPWRTQVRDCQRAVQFVRFNAGKYGLNPTAIGAMGHSSGATMTAFLAVLDDVADPQSSDPVNRESSRIQAAVAVSGVHDLLAALQQKPAESGVLGGFVGRLIMYQPPGHPVFADYRAASTVSHVTKAAAPTLLIHGEADAAVDYRQSVGFDEALAKAGVPHELVLIPGAGHNRLAPGTTVSPTPGERAAAWFLARLRPAG